MHEKRKMFDLTQKSNVSCYMGFGKKAFNK